ncbi:MAG: hypothetical protein WD801_02270 [Gemmatimonadaceae bacterium]
MLRDQQDYLMRMIAIAAAAVARLRARLLEGDAPDEIVQEARAAQGELLGKDAGMLRMLDPSSAAHVLGDKLRLEQWAELLRVEAEAQRRAGREAEAQSLETRAASLSR